MQSEIITIIIPPGMWIDAEGDASRLICVISINGTLLHLEAIRVRHDEQRRELRPVNPEHDADFDHLCSYGSEGRFETTDHQRQEVRARRDAVRVRPAMHIHLVILNVEGDQVGAWATVHAAKAAALVEKLEAHYGGADDHAAHRIAPTAISLLVRFHPHPTTRIPEGRSHP